LEDASIFRVEEKANNEKEAGDKQNSSTRLHSLMSQMIIFFIAAAIRT
jgi:hypothetical protein